MLDPETHQITTAGELFELAHETEAYINSSTRKQRKKIREAETSLNALATDLYLGQLVNLTGILISSGPDAKRSDPAMVETHIRFGSVDGGSAGFTILDLEDDLEPLEQNFDENELELTATIKDRAYGRYAVCHLVSYLQGNWVPKNRLISTDVIYRAAGPISSSKLHVDKKLDPIPMDERHKEVSRILDTLPEAQMKLLKHVCTSITESDSPMDSLMGSGRKLRELFTQANEIDRAALMFVLDFHVGRELGGKQFKFGNGLPVSVKPNSNKLADLCFFDGITPLLVQVDGVANAQHYLDSNEAEVTLSRERSFFLRTTVWDECGESSSLLIPVEHLHNYPYEEVLPE